MSTKILLAVLRWGAILGLAILAVMVSLAVYRVMNPHDIP